MAEPGVREIAASHLVERVPTAGPEDAVGEAIDRLPGTAYDAAGAVYVLDGAGRLVGVVRLPDLLIADRATPLSALMEREPAAVRLEEDQERVAHAALRHGVSAVPVVDEGGRLLGVVPPRALIEILYREHVEDLHRLAGVREDAALARDALEAPPARQTADRLPWLLVGLAGSAAATAVMASFESELRERVAVAFFVPGIVYLADAIGTQTEAIAVRGLSLSRARLRDLLGQELGAGALMGLVLGAIAFPFVWLAFGEARLALAVLLALLAAGATAATVGLFLPWALARAGRDPAYGSGPLATIIQDVLSLLLYFATVRALMG